MTQDTITKYIEEFRQVFKNSTYPVSTASGKKLEIRTGLGNMEAFLENTLQEIAEEAKREEVKKSNEVLRSAYQIAARHGADTNWDTWIKRLEKILKEQHKIMYPDSLSQKQEEKKKQPKLKKSGNRTYEETLELVKQVEKKRDERLGKLKKFLEDIDLLSRGKCKYCKGPLDESNWKYAVCKKCGKKQ